MSVPFNTDHPQISLAYLPPTPRQTRSSLAGAAVLLVGLAVLARFAGIPLPQANGFIPALDATIFVTDLITASLLFAHFSITRSRALLVLACGYLFSAMIVAAHGSSFPEAFWPTENLSRSVRINFRIYLFWHLGLPATLFAYVWLRAKDRTKAPVHAPTVLVAICSVAGVLALVSGLVWLAAAGDEFLPFPLSNFNPFSSLAPPWLVGLTMLMCAASLFVLWAFRRSVLDQWLMIVVLASMVELAITGRFGWFHAPGFRSRFTLGFYTGRVLFSLITSTVVLTALIAETTRLYARVAHASMLASVVKASQALSSEIALPNLIDRLMKIAIEHTGADRGLLILPSGDEYLIQAEARATGDGIEVTMRQELITGIACPESLVRHVIHTRQRVILDDASKPGLFLGDTFLRDRRTKSLLCLPLIKQRELTGILVLENTTTLQAFTPARIAALELLAAQAAISLENTRLYADLQLQVGLLQYLPASAWTLKPDGAPDFVNQVWLEFSGQTLDFIRSHPEAWMTAVHPEDRDRAAKIFWAGVHSGQDFAIETRSLRARDGTYRWHLQQAVVLRDSEGKVLKFVGTTTDVDDLKRAQEELRASDSKFRKIVESIPGFVCTMSPTGEILHVNQRALDYFGKTLEELKEWRFNNIVHPDELPRITEEITKSLTTGTPFDAEVRLRRADGVYRWFQDSALPVRDTEGRIAGWYFLITEIDDQKRAEESLRQTQAELAHAARVTTMGELTASMAHEINQPLSGIITNASTCLRMLAADPPNLDGVRETTLRIIRDGNRASDVIKRLRALFSKKAPTIELVDLNEATQEVIALSRSELQRNQAILSPELADGLPTIAGDRIQLQQVILNLLLNASEAMRGVDDRPRKLVVRTESDEDDHVRLSVKDSGVGLEPQLVSKLFEPFYTTKSGGMGIGLSVSRSIIENHNGRIWATPNDGPGATFSFSLPHNRQSVADPH